MADAGPKTLDQIAKLHDPAKATALDRFRAGKAAEVMALSYEELLATLTEENELVDVSMAGDGYVKPESNERAKHGLVGLAFIIVDWRFSPGMGPRGEKVTLRIKTQHNDHLIINDGGTGIYEQMAAVRDAGYTGAIVCRNGLRSSTYSVVDRETVCETCGGQRRIDNKVCGACEGTGFTIVTDANGRPLKGTTFYLDTSAAK
jgi:hypothetical protein